MIPAPTNQQSNQAVLLSPIGSTVLLGTSSAPVIAANQSRRAIAFYNSGNVTVYVCPSNRMAVTGQGVPIFPGAAMTFNGDPNANLTFNCGWNGVAAGGSNNPLTVLDISTAEAAAIVGGVILTSESGVTLIAEDGKILIAG